MGKSSSESTGHWAILLRMVRSTGRWLLKTHLKWGPKTDMFSFQLVAMFPFGIFMAIKTDFLWWAVEPPVRRRMCSQASLGFIAMSWILEQRWAAHCALAMSTLSLMVLLRRARHALYWQWRKVEWQRSRGRGSVGCICWWGGQCSLNRRWTSHPPWTWQGRLCLFPLSWFCHGSLCTACNPCSWQLVVCHCSRCLWLCLQQSCASWWYLGLWQLTICAWVR